MFTIFLYNIQQFPSLSHFPWNDFSAYRNAAYRSFTLWAHGRLGFGNRRPVPSCVVAMIRQRFPEPNGEYVGYHEVQDALREWHILSDTLFPTKIPVILFFS